MIDCCGCGNWELIENLIEDVDNLKWCCLDESNNLTFGKYKGMNVDEVKSKDEDYFKWALGYVGGFHELIFSRKYNISLQELLNTKKQIKKHLSFSSDDWIKSSIGCNYDFYLDQYKYACCARQKKLETAIKEIEEYKIEKGYTIDAERFFDFYESKGWFVGKNKMKDWKAAIRNWAKSEKERRSTYSSKVQTIKANDEWK